MNVFKLLLLVGCTAVAANAQVTTQPSQNTYRYSGEPIAIPFANSGVSAVAQIYVPDNLIISAVTTQIQITYPRVGDLTVYLFSARGTRTIMLQNDCGNLANVNTTFDDTAQSKFSDFCPQEPGRGPFRPDEPLANSKGENAAGYWNLVVTNTNSNSNTGVVQAFSLTITGTAITSPTFTTGSIVNAASLAGGVIAPGELASIFGFALGPTPGVTSSGGTLGTTLGGTTISVNGTPAPILYASANQVNFQVPYQVQAGTTATIQVRNAAGTSASIIIDVLSSAAGLFTNQSNGLGQVAAINQDGTINSSTNPAPAGSYVAIYATGLGAVSPAVNAGVPASSTTLSTVTAPGGVTVILAGLTAPVTFAGLAPGFVGLYQINIQIPSTTTSGPRRLFVIMPNGYSSQPGVFLAVQ